MLVGSGLALIDTDGPVYVSPCRTFILTDSSASKPTEYAATAIEEPNLPSPVIPEPAAVKFRTSRRRSTFDVPVCLPDLQSGYSGPIDGTEIALDNFRRLSRLRKQQQKSNSNAIDSVSTDEPQ